MTVHELIIIGSGPAGYTAAIYAARAALNPIVFEGALDGGGALMNTTEVENFPGFPDGVMGPDLMGKMRSQAEKFGATLITDDAEAVDLTGRVKHVTDSAGKVWEAKAVILAMGSGYRKLGVDGEERLSGRGVSWCATCDGAFFRDKPIAVIGGGDSAVEEATFLTRFGSSVTLVHRRDELRASKAMAARAEKDPKLDFAWNSVVESMNGDNRVESVTLQGKDGSTHSGLIGADYAVNGTFYPSLVSTVTVYDSQGNKCDVPVLLTKTKANTWKMSLQSGGDSATIKREDGLRRRFAWKTKKIWSLIPMGDMFKGALSYR